MLFGLFNWILKQADMLLIDLNSISEWFSKTFLSQFATNNSAQLTHVLFLICHFFLWRKKRTQWKHFLDCAGSFELQNDLNFADFSNTCFNKNYEPTQKRKLTKIHRFYKYSYHWFGVWFTEKSNRRYWKLFNHRSKQNFLSNAKKFQRW